MVTVSELLNYGWIIWKAACCDCTRTYAGSIYVGNKDVVEAQSIVALKQRFDQRLWWRKLYTFSTCNPFCTKAINAYVYSKTGSGHTVGTTPGIPVRVAAAA
ncbi:MAG: hypothetical protein R2851_16115 [Caldilineaceae bacterium]